MPPVLLFLVEDDHLVQPVLIEALEEAGYTTEVASNGTEAIERLEREAEQFKAVITDIKLGTGPSGWEVAHRARELVPAMPIIYMSGDSGREWAANGVPNSLMLQKPFALAQLVTAVSNLITAASSSPAASSGA